MAVGWLVLYCLYCTEAHLPDKVQQCRSCSQTLQAAVEAAAATNQIAANTALQTFHCLAARQLGTEAQLAAADDDEVPQTLQKLLAVVQEAEFGVGLGVQRSAACCLGC